MQLHSLSDEELFPNCESGLIISLICKPFVQETLCMPPGLECYKSVKKSSEKCRIPCKGIYADVVRKEGFKQTEDVRKIKAALGNYKEYKAGFINRTEGILLHICS